MFNTTNPCGEIPLGGGPTDGFDYRDTPDGVPRIAMTRASALTPFCGKPLPVHAYRPGDVVAEEYYPGTHGIVVGIKRSKRGRFDDEVTVIWSTSRQRRRGGPTGV